jgi:hypothetical protein
MKALDPAPSVPIDGSAAQLVATEGRRGPRGIAATVQLLNGDLIDARAVELANAKDRKNFAKEIAELGEGFSLDNVERASVILLAAVDQALRSQGTSASGSQQSQPDLLVDLAESSGVEPFRDADDVAYAIIRRGNGNVAVETRSSVFRLYLRRLLYEQAGKAANANALTDAIGTLEAKALFEGPTLDVHVRVARLGRRVVIDLADPEGRAVVVENGEWSITTDPPERFIRGRGMQALPEPIRGGSIDELQNFLNLLDGAAGDDLFRLIVVWIVAALTGLPPYAVLVLIGESGSGKTTAGRVLRGVVDPNTAALRNAPKDAQAIALATKANHIVGYDNLSRITPATSDALCGLATGQAFPTRKLYTTDEEVLFQATRPQILTSITEVVARPDLLSRSLLIELPRMELPKDEETFWRDYAKAQPRLFGAILDVLARVLVMRNEIRLDGAPRMADFAITGVAVEKVLGWPEGAFVSAYDRNRALGNASALDSAIGQAIVTFFDEKKPLATPEGIVWDGTVGILLEALNLCASERTQRLKQWPQTPRGLSAALRQLAPNLRIVGIDVRFGERGREGTKLSLAIRELPQGKAGGKPSQPSQPSPKERDDSDERPVEKF